MGTITDMDMEIRYQIDDLPNYARTLPPSEGEGRGLVFSGAGDSMAAALAAEHYSGYEAPALDPYNLALDPEPLKGKNLYLISVSGRTTANIGAAKAAREYARSITAITADPQSRLAQLCDRSIELRFRRTGNLTPGTNSFTVSLLAVLSRLRRLPPIGDLHGTYERAKAWASGIQMDEGRTIFFVGITGLHPLTLYGAAKVYETLGWRAQCQHLEQFSHMELFSLTSGDTVIILSSPQEVNGRSVKLVEALRGLDINTYLLKSEAEDYVNLCLNTAIHLQVLAWTLAVRKGLSDCAFLTKRSLLKASDKMIY